MTPDASDPRAQNVRSEALDGVRRRARVLKPAAGLDVPALSDAEMARFNLPPRPDARADPQLFKLWRRMFSPPLRFVDASFGIQQQARHSLLRTPVTRTSEAIASAGATRAGGSRNWAGAVASAHGGMRFTSVWGSWRVPTPHAPAGADPATPPPGGQYQCSSWIGLDGHRLHSVSMPQMGTTQALQLVDGAWAAKVSVWHQWWTRGQNFPFVTLESFALDPEDEVIATLTVVNPLTVRFTIKNQSKGDCALVERSADSPLTPVEGSAAEWIVERPTDLDDESILYELPDYGSVTFTDCAATLAGVPCALEARRLIRMHRSRDNPHRTETISVPEEVAAGGRSLRVVYRASS